MSITVKKTGDEGDFVLSFGIKGVTPAYANTLRRLMTHEVPTMAIEVVEFKHNGSILYDEMVAHRLGLVPLTTDLDSYRMKQSAEDDGNPSCEVTFTLQAEGPKTVYSGDLVSSDPKVKPVYDDIPILKLLEGQKIELSAVAVLGIGKTHTKWCPGHVYYRRPGSDEAGGTSASDASKYDFIFTIESWGQLPPKEIVARAVDSFDTQLDDFKKSLSTLK